MVESALREEKQTMGFLKILFNLYEKMVAATC